MILEIPHPDFGTVRQVASPIKISDFAPEHSRGPRLGEHTEEVLSGYLGISPPEIAELRREGVI
jgi:crotonobetainyl-CoA:carnitine CoA-transferase CaiB-like acyl-CoA transferase